MIHFEKLDTDFCRFQFPDIHEADENGLLCYGGDLSIMTMTYAYSRGIFPWYEKPPILWYAPAERCLLHLEKLRVSRSLKKLLNKKKFLIEIDKDFDSIIHFCKNVYNDSTWITPEYILSYCDLFDVGLAHCAGAYYENELVGGLFGLSLGKFFFGESMAYTLSGASKVAFVFMAKKMQELGIEWVDCQISSNVMDDFGSQKVSRYEFAKILKEKINYPTAIGRWNESTMGNGMN